MERDHWAFGVGWVDDSWHDADLALSYLQPADLSGRKICRPRNLAGPLAYAVGLQNGRNPWRTHWFEGVWWPFRSIAGAVPHQDNPPSWPGGGGSWRLTHCSKLQDDCLKFMFVKVVLFSYLLLISPLFPSSCTRTFDNKLLNHVYQTCSGVLF